MSQILIAYASKHGHTAKIAARIASVIREEGVVVDTCDLGRGADVDPGGYDGVIVGASLHAGTHQREVFGWVKRHHEVLTARPTLFLSVSLSAADRGEEARADTRHCIDRFVDQSGWTPGRSEAIAGALQYREYDVFTRVLMRLMARRAGHPEPDTSHDHEYTDWPELERIAREFATEAASVVRHAD